MILPADFQVRKCDDGVCPGHKPLRGQETISAFPDPVSSEINAVPYYHEAVYPKEEILPFVLNDVGKSALGIPFNPTAKTAKNVKFIVRFEECQKPRLVYSKLKLKKENLQEAQRMLKKLYSMCRA